MTRTSLYAKNEIIRATLKETRERRKAETCKQYELKVDVSHLSRETLKALFVLFLEAKWFYNHVLAAANIFDTDYRIDRVKIKVRDHFETRDIVYLSSQMKQELIDRMQDGIRGLSRLKQKGHKVGWLKFKSEINSIPLKQYGNTYKILDKHYVHIQGIKQPFKVSGLSQIPKDAELASALLLKKHGDYYLHVITYQTKVVPMHREEKQQLNSVGIDLGIKNQLTLSNGIRINYEVPISKRIRRLCKKLSRKKYHSRNWWKGKTKLEKAYEDTTNIKRDIRNKLVHKLTSHFHTICLQDDSIKTWQRIWGKRILNTSLGGITSAIKRKARTFSEVERGAPTTEECSRCGAKNKMGLNDRIYIC
ncbi:MAG TPA: transposase, partial [Nitrososphaerales archaeon]|nr:transposase [Nitrososphaerales archaeon]